MEDSVILGAMLDGLSYWIRMTEEVKSSVGVLARTCTDLFWLIRSMTLRSNNHSLAG